MKTLYLRYLLLSAPRVKMKTLLFDISMHKYIQGNDVIQTVLTQFVRLNK